MAKRTQRDDDQGKKPDAAAEPPRTPRPGVKSPPTPQVAPANQEVEEVVAAAQPPRTPRPGVKSPPTPQVVPASLAVDATGADVAVADAMLTPPVAVPDSAVVAGLLEISPLAQMAADAFEDVHAIGESDVFLGVEVEETPATKAETPAPQPHPSQPVSDVFLVEDAVPADETKAGFSGARWQPTTGIALSDSLEQSDEPAPSVAPLSDVHLADLFDEPSAPVAAEESVAAQEIEAAAPDSALKAEDDIFGTEISEVSAPVESASASDVDVSAESPDEFAEVVSPSDVNVLGRTSAATDVAPVEPIAEAPPADVIAAEPAVHESASLSDIVAVEDAAGDSAPMSDVPVPDEAGADAAPQSDVFGDAETAAEGAPRSDVFGVEGSAEEVAPASDVFMAEIIPAEEAVEEAAPLSDVSVSEEAVEEAAPLSDVSVSEEAVEEAAPLSDVAVSEEAVEEAAPLSDVAVSEEVVAPAAPLSDVAVSEWLVDEAVPVSDTAYTEEAVAEAAPVSDITRAEEIVEEALPDSDVTQAEEVVEEAAPTADGTLAEEAAAEAAPVSDVAVSEWMIDEAAPLPEVLPSEEAVAEAAPVSEMVQLDEAVAEAAPLPEVLPSEEVITEAAPVSDVAVSEWMIDEAAPLPEVLPSEEAVAEAASVSAVVESEEPVAEAAPVSDVALSEWMIEEAAPVSDVAVTEEADVAEAAPLSDVVESEEPVAEAAPVSDVALSEWMIEEATPISDTMEADAEVAEAAPASEFADAEEMVAEAAPISDVVKSEDASAEAVPVSEVFAYDEAVAEAVLDSDMVLAGEIVEDAAPLSDEVFLGELVEEAASVSDVSAFEEAVDEAVPAFDVVSADEDVEEAAPVSDIADAEEIVEELAEAVEEPSSATRQAEAVFGDEKIATIVGSGARQSPRPVQADLNETEFMEEPPTKGSDIQPDEDVLEAEPARSGSSAVLYEEVAAEGSAGQPKSGVGRTKGDDLDRTAAFDQTMAFEGKPPSSVAKKGPPSSLVTEEEVASTSEASAVEQGAFDIDKVAEALESGLDEAEPLADTAAPEPSVLFDDLIEDDIAEAVEDEDAPPAKKHKTKATRGDSFADLDADALEIEEVVEEADEAEVIEAVDDDDELIVAKKDTKKGKTDAMALGEDIDLDALFSEAEGEEAAEAIEIDDAELEAAEAFDDEVEAAEAFDDELEATDVQDVEALAAAAAEDVDLLDEEEEKPTRKTTLATRTALHKLNLADEEIEIAQDEDEEKPIKKTSLGKKTTLYEGTLDDEEVEVAQEEDEDDDRPTKKTKMAKRTAIPKNLAADEDDFDADYDDDEEGASAKKKKGKKDKRDRTTVAPAAGPGFVMRWAGRFFLMFFGMILLGGGVGAAVYFAPEDTLSIVPEEYRKDLAAHLHKPPPPPEPKKVDERKPIDKLRDIMAAGDFKKVADGLANANLKDELSLRGEAKWRAYVKEQDDAKKALDKDAKEVADAKADLEAADNKALLKQIDLMIERQAFADIVADKQKAEKLIADLSEVLVKGGIIDDKAKLDPKMLPDVFKALNDDRATLDVVNSILKEADFKTGEAGLIDLFEVIGALAEDRSGLRKDVDAIDDVLKTAKAKEIGEKGVLEIVEDRDKTTKDRDDLFDTVKLAFKELVDGKIVVDPAAEARKDIIKGVQTARLKAESPLSIPLSQLGLALGNIGMGTSKAVEQTFDMTKVVAELGYFQSREKFIQTPQQKMTTYITLLQDRKENDANQMAAIIREADWVDSDESRSDDDARGRGRYVKGLALRNQEKFAEAKKVFEETVSKIPPGPKAGAWSKLAQQSLKELTDPHAYYIKRMDQYRGEENFDAALAEANLALKAIPEDARLNAHRALIRFELMRHKRAKVTADDQKAIRDDAEIVGKDDKLGAESSFLFGQLEDELGNMPEAEKLYKKAIKLHEDMKGPPDNAGKYRVALGRLLLKDRTEVPEKKDEEKKKEEEKKLDDEKKKDLSAAPAIEERVIVMHPWTPLIVACVIAQQPDEVEDKETLERYKAVMDEANKLIGSTNPVLKGQGHMLLGQVYSKLGRRTEGLKEYARGLGQLTEKTKLKPKDIDDLIELIDNHPAFSQPDISATLNPVMAERHFGEGIHLYWAKQYPEAEAQFRQAVKYYHIDARYQYYLGLSQLGQRTIKKRDAAIFSLEQGARLEAKAAATNPFAVREINASLERVQGELRQYLNGIRYKVQMSDLDEKLKAL